MPKVFEFTRRSFQSQERLDAATLTAWERQTGWSLPNDYRRFLLRTNGGLLRPYCFIAEVATPYVVERRPTLDGLYDWRAVLDESQLDIGPRTRNTPPGFLAIGDTIGELCVMLALTRADHGAVALWVKDLLNPWGEGPNDAVTPVAPSFSAFLDMLHIPEPDDTYHPYWSVPDATDPEPQWIEL